MRAEYQERERIEEQDRLYRRHRQQRLGHQRTEEEGSRVARLDTAVSCDQIVCSYQTRDGGELSGVKADLQGGTDEPHSVDPPHSEHIEAGQDYDRSITTALATSVAIIIRLRSTRSTQAPSTARRAGKGGTSKAVTRPRFTGEPELNTNRGRANNVKEPPKLEIVCPAQNLQKSPPRHPHRGVRGIRCHPRPLAMGKRILPFGGRR